MTNTMLWTKMLVGMTILAVLGTSLPSALAEDISRARTDEGGCVLVAWTAQPYVISNATGCNSGDPCVHVNWTTVPPQAGIVDC